MTQTEFDKLLTMIEAEINQVDADHAAGLICKRTATQRRNALLDAILYF